MIENQKKQPIKKIIYTMVMLWLTACVPLTALAHTETPDSTAQHTISRSQWIVPAAVLGMTVVGTMHQGFKAADQHFTHEIDQISTQNVGIDNYLEYLPSLAVHGYSLLGAPSKHLWGDKLLLHALSTAIVVGVTQGGKRVFRVERPDGSDLHSYPSGHTSMAFMAADLIFLEYPNASPWIRYSGYAMATATALLRIYNGKHHFNDVIAGATVGMLSTRLAYWLYPKLRGKHPHRPQQATTQWALMPYTDGRSIGIGGAWVF